MQDQRDQPLVDTEDKITFCLSNLMLSGVATPYLHNGIQTVDYNEESNYDFGDGKVGIINRNEMGLLVWDTNPKKTGEMGLGSRLKTPILPIWVTCVNGNWGVLFNPNKDLMKSYAAENRFNLYYYSNTQVKDQKIKTDTILTIDTRNTMLAKKQQTPDVNDDFEVIEVNPVERTIQTKWEDAAIEWQHVQPYV